MEIKRFCHIIQPSESEMGAKNGYGPRWPYDELIIGRNDLRPYELDWTKFVPKLKKCTKRLVLKSNLG